MYDFNLRESMTFSIHSSSSRGNSFSKPEKYEMKSVLFLLLFSSQKKEEQQLLSTTHHVGILYKYLISSFEYIGKALEGSLTRQLFNFMAILKNSI